MMNYQYRNTLKLCRPQGGIDEVKERLRKRKSSFFRASPHNEVFNEKLLLHEKLDLRIKDEQLIGDILLENGVKTKIIVNLKYPTPRVSCDATWLRRDPDWHTYTQGNVLCWVFAEEWQFYTEKWIAEEVSISIVANRMSEFLYRNVEYILRLHYIAFENSIDHWLPEWGGYSHGRQAAKEQLLQKIKIQDLIYLS